VTADAPRRARLFVIDDHALVRLGMRQLLDSEPDLQVCGDAEDLAGALKKLADTPTDLVLLDLSLRTGDGIDALRQLRAERPDLRILVITTHDEKVYGERVIRGGAIGYVMKAVPADELIGAIRKALRGELAVSPALAASLLHTVVLGQQRPPARDPLEPLSEREREIFKLIGEGLSTRDVSIALGISAKTVETHQFNLRTKLGIASTHQLRHLAFTWVSRGGSLDEAAWNRAREFEDK
jgi:DNA-binding NarL/FixJ family response regulator